MSYIIQQLPCKINKCIEKSHTNQMTIPVQIQFYSIVVQLNIIMESKVRQLQNKLQTLQIPQPEQVDSSIKVKVRTIQHLLSKLQQRYEQENIAYEHKVANLLETVHKIQISLNDSDNQIEVQEHSWNNRVVRMEKAVKKIIDRLAKERKQSDKKIQSTLETYLIELTSFKGKASTSCQGSIRELKELQKEVDIIDREVKRESQLSRDIYKKIYAQFSTQIEDIGASLVTEESVRREEEEKVIDSIERSYTSLSGSIVQGRKARQRHEKEIVDLLERVIEKIKYQILNE